MKRYNLEQLEKELIKAQKAAEKAEKAAREAEKASSENMPPHRPRFKRTEDETAAVEAWVKNYVEPAQKANQRAAASKLYVKAITEMWQRELNDTINAIISSPEFLEKYDGVPVRYKKLQKALFGGFDSRYHFYFTGVWNCRIGCSFRPDKEKNPYMYFDCDFYYWGDSYDYKTGDTVISADEVQKRVEYAANPDKAISPDYVQPEFKAVKRACNRAAAVAHKYDEILETAARKVNELVKANSCGLSVVSSAMNGKKTIEYRH